MGTQAKNPEVWNQFYKAINATDQRLLYPSETLVRLFKGDYVPDLSKDFVGKNILDVGCGSLNNLLFLTTLGCNVFGTEVHEEICKDAMASLSALGQNADIRVGFNQDLPFDDAFFDFLVAWSVMHYGETENEMARTIAEYARVLRPGSYLFALTTAPLHKIKNGAEKLDENRFRINVQGDAREGQIFWYFHSEEQIKAMLAPAFTKVHVGRITDRLITQTLDHFLIVARK